MAPPIARKKDLESENAELRRNCLLVHGVEETPEENCLKTAVTLFRDKLNVQIDVRRLDRAHRVGKPKSDDKPRPVIVKFVSYQDRHQVWWLKLWQVHAMFGRKMVKLFSSVLTGVGYTPSLSKMWNLQGRISPPIARPGAGDEIKFSPREKIDEGVKNQPELQEQRTVNN
ncbi:hypothetical protein J437_LFUL018218 [Ladona fulva]|uniref:Uncharacterized protein n=1 Tax=Ladona fulva TaxID=123851 RepID=A0A8K0KUK5_LADFU|nr:hypothetical protein J437_LFUL018218 [Ladona fulva]